MVREGGISFLLEFLRSGTDDHKLFAARALGNIAYDKDACCIEISDRKIQCLIVQPPSLHHSNGNRISAKHRPLQEDSRREVRCVVALALLANDWQKCDELGNSFCLRRVKGLPRATLIAALSHLGEWTIFDAGSRRPSMVGYFSNSEMKSSRASAIVVRSS
ncbi:Armadillo-type fold [Phytophthora cactorum]|nr:Armadillo-type fold [Phytophthora cactorum]